jgi:hypothetical protein
MSMTVGRHSTSEYLDLPNAFLLTGCPVGVDTVVPLRCPASDQLTCLDSST